MLVSFCYYHTIRILTSKTLTGTYEGGYTYVFEMCCYRTLDLVLYILLQINNNVYNKILRSITTHLKYIRVTSFICTS